MKRIRTIALCLVAAFAMSAVATTTASADAPELGRCTKVVVKKTGKYSSATCTALKTGGEYEWTAGAEKPAFTDVGGAATLETVGKTKAMCKAESSKGEYTSAKTVGHVIVTFTGCEAGGLKCTTTGQAEGTVVTNSLSGSLQWENKALKKVALDLAPEAGEVFVEFICGPLTVRVRGSLLVNVKAGKMETKPVQKYVAKNGIQKPSEYETAGGEKVKDFLEGEAGGKAERAGMTLTDTQTNEEALEVNWFATPKPPKWWVEGKELVGAEPIAEETNVTVPFKLEFSLEGGKGPKFTIECSKEKVKNGTIEGPGARNEEAEIYEGCKVVGKEASCSVATVGSPVGTVKSEPLKAVLEGTAGAEKLKFEPKAGSRIAAYEITGAGCTAKGFYEADGSMICGYPSVETEGSEHPLVFTKTSGSIIKVAGHEAKLTVTDNVHLTSGRLWSAF